MEHIHCQIFNDEFIVDVHISGSNQDETLLHFCGRFYLT